MSLFAIVRVYPAVLLVLTLTVSLWLLIEPDAVGVTLIVTVPLVVMLIVEPIDALIVVSSVAADAAIGDTTTAKTPIKNVDRYSICFFVCFICNPFVGIARSDYGRLNRLCQRSFVVIYDHNLVFYQHF